MPCNKPLEIKVNGQTFPVPCRWCMGCRIDRRNLWNNRIRWHMQELQKQGYRSSFVTLTYDENHYKGGVCKNDIVKCIKRLRKYLSSNTDIRNCRSFKYYIVSEFGDNTDRGHYHGIFLGLESSFLKHFLRKAWRFGFIEVAPLIPARISYTLKYMDKQQFGDDVSKYGLDDIIRVPFVLASKGIGADYLKKISKECENGFIYSNGHYIRFPKYYAQKFGVDNALVEAKGIENEKECARINGMSIKDYRLQSRYAKESKLVSIARNAQQVVDESHLKTIKSLLEKPSNIGDKIAKELNYENE